VEADERMIKAMVNALRRASYALNCIPRQELPDGTDSYEAAAEVDSVLRQVDSLESSEGEQI